MCGTWVIIVYDPFNFGLLFCARVRDCTFSHSERGDVIERAFCQAWVVVSTCVQSKIQPGHVPEPHRPALVFFVAVL
jgi:hypothetical protein